MEDVKKPIVFAVFGDDSFISWTYGMFTQFVERPKLYPNLQSQIDTCNSNFHSVIKTYFDNKPVIEFDESTDVTNNKLNGYGTLKLLNNIATVTLPKNKLDNYSNFSFRCYEIDLDYGKHNDWKFPSHEEFDEALSKIDLNKPINIYKYDC